VPRARFRLSLIGRFELTGPDGAIDLPSKKLAGLLAYLACSAPVPQPREKLATLLWGSHFEVQARQNLRQALFRLRRMLGPDTLIADGEEISLAPGAMDCDAARLETLVREGSLGSLAVAVDLYKDRLLADLSVAEEAWDDWLDGERRRLEALALDAMVRLADLELQSGAPDRALANANKAILVSNLREDAHRLAIRALAAAGRRGDALKHYEHLAGLLKSELDVEPDAATQALVRDLRKSQSTTSTPVAERVRPTLPPLSDRPSIAVLAFANMSGDAEQEYFADGIAEDVLTALSKWRWFQVFARNSTFTFKGKAVSVRQIGEALGARYVLEGSVRRVGDRVRISAQLIEAATDRHIWAERYDRDISDIFAIQDDITRHVVTSINPAIEVSELERVARKLPGSMDAWDHYLRGNHHRNRFTAQDAVLALHHFSQAIDIDPHFAAAHARLAQLHVNLATLNPTADTPKTLATALELAKRAIALDPLDASAHAAAAYVLVHSRQHDAALQAGHSAVELNANYPAGRYALGLALLFAGSAREAIAEFEMTARLSPRDPAMWAILGYQALAQYTAGYYEAALCTADRADAERPEFGARAVRIAALVRLSRKTEAAAAMAALPKEALLRMPYLCPFRNTADWEHWCSALEEAGWSGIGQ
jgi:TolB-like protein